MFRFFFPQLVYWLNSICCAICAHRDGCSRVCVFPAGSGSNFRIMVGSASGPGSTFKAFLGSAQVQVPLSNKIWVRVGSVQHIYGSLRVWVQIFGPVKTSSVRACVREREREREEKGSHLSTSAILIVAFVWVCVWERERRSHHSGVYSASEIVLIAACLQTHTRIITVSVTRPCSPLGLELMVKLRTLLTVFTFILKAEARDYGKGRYISDVACGVRPITMHCASWPIRAHCACWKERLCINRSVWERRGIEDLQ